MASPIDFKALRTTIKEKCDREVTKELLESLGVEVRRDFRFNENDSFSIAKDGTIKDFGSTDFSGDVVSFMIDILGTSHRDAIEWVAKSLGVWNE
ncbi:MAG: hypothetical protein NTY39_11345 [Campylobacterales bacterium]|nr:hypothetical protein [Campylobacterales bacterium]